MKLRGFALIFAILWVFFFVFPKAVVSASILGINTVGTTGYPAQGLRRVKGMIFSSMNYQGLYGAGIDAANGYAYFAGRKGTLTKVNLSTFTEESTLTLSASGNSSDIGVDSANGFAYFYSGGGFTYKVKLGGAFVAPIEETKFLPGGFPAGAPLIDASNPDPTKHYAYSIDFKSPATVYKYLLPSPSALDPDNKPPTLLSSIVLNAPLFPSSGFAEHGVLDTIAGFGYFTSAGCNQIVKIALNGAGPPTEVGILTTTDPANIRYGRIPSIDTSGATHYLYLQAYNPFPVSGLIKINLSTFTEVATASFNPGSGGCNGPTAQEMGMATGLGDQVSGSLIYGSDLVYPMKIFKVKSGAGNAAPVENSGVPLALSPGASVPPCDGTNVLNNSTDGGLTLPYGEVFCQGAVIDNANGYAYFGTDNVPAQVVKVAFSQKAAIKGSKVVLGQPAAVNSINFYSHAAAGNLRLALYDNSVPKNLLWDSGNFANGTNGGWISRVIASGSPSSLTLASGTYWLCWQLDNTLDVPSYTLGSPGDGFLFDQPYGAYPASIVGAQPSSETWSEYLDYSVFTPTPSSTVSATPANTFTHTPTASASITVASTATPTPTASASPTATGTATPTATHTASPTATTTVSPSPSPSSSPTISTSPTATPTSTASASSTATGTATSTATRSATHTASPTATTTGSPSPSPSSSPTISTSPTSTLTFTASASSTATGTATPTATRSPTHTASPTATMTASPSPSPSSSPTASTSPTATPAFSATSSPTATPTVTSGSGASSNPVPGQTEDLISYPNPVFPGALVNVAFAPAANATLAVYDWSGRRLFELKQNRISASQGSATWDGRDASGQDLASGLYFLVLKTERGNQIHKFTVQRP